MANMTFKANLLPSSNLGYNLGSSTQKWNVYGNLTGNADSATSLTSSAGSSTIPIYFSSGKPVQCSTTLGVSITGNANSATKSGDSGLYLYPERSNELNFGGSNSATDIYIGFRAKDNRNIPTNFIFGGRGTANLTAATFTGVLNGTTKTPSSTKISIAGAYNNVQATLLKSDHIVSLIFSGDFSSMASGVVTLATLPQGYRPPDTVYFSGGNCCYVSDPWVFFWIDTAGALKRYSSSAESSRCNGGFSITYITLQ